MTRTAERLRRDLLAIWRAGLDAVDSARLVREAVRTEGKWLRLAGRAGGSDVSVDLSGVGRIAVVGGGKAGAGMARGLLEALAAQVVEKEVVGWLNVPADCLQPLGRIHLHAGRDQGSNEPTAAGAAGVREILRIVEGLNSTDLCFCLLSGGASALLPAPAEGITLADKLAVTRLLSESGANIAELNTVRKQLSAIKGGRLARACRAGRLITLVISDVIGDPLDVIASGPTMEDPSTATDALEVLSRYGGREAGIPAAVFEFLEQGGSRAKGPPECQVDHVIIGNSATAVEAAAAVAARLGYCPEQEVARALEGLAEDVGRRLAERAKSMRRGPGADCLVSGGEPVVKLADPRRRGLGGRNQQLALAALELLLPDGEGLALLSGGTDGEDGPTDAAGALVDAEVIQQARRRRLDPGDFLRRNDAYHFFEPLGGLVKTGATHTNVGDLRVVLVDRVEQAGRASPAVLD